MKIETDAARHFTRSKAKAVPVHCVDDAALKSAKSGLSKETRAWAKASGFAGKPGQLCLIPGNKQDIARVLFGIGKDDGPMALAKLARTLPKGRYAVQDAPGTQSEVELAWALGGYSFDRYRKRKHDTPQLVASSKGVVHAPRGRRVHRP